MKPEIDPNVTECDWCVLVKHLRAGQSRPYADAVYESLITFTGKNTATDKTKFLSVCGSALGPDLAVKYVPLVVRSYNPDAPKGGLSPYLDLFKEEERGPGYITYRARVIVPNCD